MATNPTEAPLAQVGIDLQNVHSKADLAHVFKELHDMRGEPQKLNETLMNLNQHHLNLPPELKLQNFQVVGYDKKNEVLIFGAPKQAAQALSANGTEYKETARGSRQFDLRHPIASMLPDVAPPSPTAGRQTPVESGQRPVESGTPPPNGAGNQTGQPASVEFGAHGRKIDVAADGSASYTAVKGDNLWRIATDLLTKADHQPSQNEVGNMVNSIAKANQMPNPDFLAIGQKISVPPPEKAPPAIPPNTEMTPPATPPAEQPPPSGQPSKPPESGNPAETGKPITQASYEPLNLQSLTAESAQVFQPVDGKFNPLAPKGLAEGTPFQQLTESTDGIRRRDVAEGTDSAGHKTRTYDGAFDDGSYLGMGMFRTTFSGNETMDDQGRLLSRHLEYHQSISHDPAMDFEDGGNGFHVKRVKSIDTEWQPTTGHYRNTITDQQGRSQTVYTDEKGTVLSADEQAKARAAEAANPPK